MKIEKFRDMLDTNTKAVFYKKRIIEHVIDIGPETLPNLAKHLEVSVPTVSKMVSELVDTGIFKSYGKLETSGGRHPFLYGLDPENCYFLGVDFETNKMNLMLMDLCGEQVREEMGRPFAFENTEECLQELCDVVNDFLDREGPDDRAKTVSIGMNIYGRLNPNTGYSYTYFNFSEVPLAKVLSSKIGIETFIDNDSRACAFGEYMTHYKENGSNMLFVNMTWGLGLGIIVDGKPYTGKSGFSGEFGHIHAYENEVLCHCGKKGCLETEASGRAFYRKFMERVKSGDNSILRSAKSDLHKPLDEITLQDLIEATRREDMLCIEILEEVGEHLGMHVASLINIFNPNVVVVGGVLANTGDYLMQPMRSAIRKYSLNMVNQDTALRQSMLLRYAGVIGACMLARKKAVERL